MKVIEKLYKPILPDQMRRFWESAHSFNLNDFAGQKVSYFFSSPQYARCLASNYATELNANCYVLSFDINRLAYRYLHFEKSLDEDCFVFGIKAEHLSLCFPKIREVTQIIDVCPPTIGNEVEQYQLFNYQNACWEMMDYA